MSSSPLPSDPSGGHSQSEGPLERPNGHSQPEGTTDFEAILAVHDKIAASMARHQATVVRDGLNPAGFQAAIDLFQSFADALRAHIRAENQFLIPAFERHCPKVIGCTPEILLAEHNKLERLITEVAEQLLSLQKAGGPDPLQIVELLERERMIKEVLEHHGIREAAGFFPNLQKMIPDPLAKELLAQCDVEHAKAEDLR